VYRPDVSVRVVRTLSVRTERTVTSTFAADELSARVTLPRMRSVVLCAPAGAANAKRSNDRGKICRNMVRRISERTDFMTEFHLYIRLTVCTHFNRKSASPLNTPRRVLLLGNET
jgi:hypothetical protein